MFNIEKYYRMIKDGNILVSHQGILNGEMIDLLIQFTEKRLFNLHTAKMVRKKIINIMIESLQNSYHYASQQEEDDFLRESPFFALSQQPDSYLIHTGNSVTKEKAGWLKKRLSQINDMNSQELQSNYINQLQNQQNMGLPGGAGLGLIDMIRKSGDKYLYHFKNLKNGYILFTLQIKIKA